MLLLVLSLRSNERHVLWRCLLAASLCHWHHLAGLYKGVAEERAGASHKS